MSARALINVPAKAKRGDVIEIKTLISHIMETGFRHGTNGQRSEERRVGKECRSRWSPYH